MGACGMLGVGGILWALSGCGASGSQMVPGVDTEVVVVVDTDLSLPVQASTFLLELSAPNLSQVIENGLLLRGAEPGPTSAPLPTFPVTLRLAAPDVQGPITVKASLLVTVTSASPPKALPGATQAPHLWVVVRRTASDVQFVTGEKSALFIALLRSCACAGTACPDPRTARECADLVDPTLSPFDPDHLPRVADADGGATAPD
jgi:hypothetical protein